MTGRGSRTCASRALVVVRSLGSALRGVLSLEPRELEDAESRSVVSDRSDARDVSVADEFAVMLRSLCGAAVSGRCVLSGRCTASGRCVVSGRCGVSAAGREGFAGAERSVGDTTSRLDGVVGA